ncbi:ester cyclase [Rhizobium brockwellii]|uniref:ester cyclase n=1 Tax=Rhizobium brockwellii TaxID=3019932 RepID=UPI003F9C56AA
MIKTELSTSKSGLCNRRHVMLGATVVLCWPLLNARQSFANSKETKMDNAATTMPTGLSRDQLVTRLKRAGELEVSGEDQAETDTYFDTTGFRFHGPDGFEADYAGLTSYFTAIRAAFDDRSIRRGIIVAERNYIACQTWIEGTFVREFTQSPVGTLPPNGKRVVWDLSNIFRFDDHGRLVEEWVRTDYRSFLRQLEA